MNPEKKNLEKKNSEKMNPAVLCADIGGTAIKYAVIERENGQILCKSACATDAKAGGLTPVEKVEQIARQLWQVYTLSGIAVSTAGVVDCDRGVVVYSGDNLPEYAGTDWKKEMRERLSLPCEAENDVNCAGLAEYRSGAAKGAKSALCLTVGTGIGGCAVLDGSVLHGASYSACEIGYMEMDGSTFEKLGSAGRLIEKVAKRKREDIENWNGIRVFAEAQKGDAVCLAAIDEMCEVLGRGIASILYVLNPEVVVLGGGIMEQKAFLAPKLEQAAARYTKPMLLSHTRIVFAQHGNDAGMLGAYYHFMNRQKGI